VCALDAGQVRKPVDASWISAAGRSATGHHDLLREDEAVDFLAVVPRLDDAVPDDFFAAGRARLGDDPLDEDFFAAGRGLLDGVARAADFFAGLLAAGADAEPRSES
jgi:hypothetical protein